MPANIITEEQAPGKTARERVHVALPDWAPHHGRIIQVMPGRKIPVDPEGNQCPIVWSESMGIGIEEAHAQYFAAKEEAAQAKKVRTAHVPGPKG